MDDPKTYEELSQRLSEADDVLTVPMRTLRNVHGMTRLGAEVVKNIDKKLMQLGIGHYPRELPVLREREVRLYRLGTPVGQLIEDAISMGSDEDERLRVAAGGSGAEQLARIREIVCE